jgi:hypothetical protein
MNRLRLLAWLIALLALIAPPAVTAHAMTPAAPAATVDCPDHAPPPDPCPAEGTAKHAMGTCCPLMAGAVALLSASMGAESAASFHPSLPPLARHLAGLLFAQDPPPPRV